jgi:general secretion pathway protein H
MRTSALGNERLTWREHRGPNSGRPGHLHGFTLIELLIVVAIVAVASAVVTLAVRDPQASALEREADRLSALLEAARAESRASGLPLLWVPVKEGATVGGSSVRPEPSTDADGRQNANVSGRASGEQTAGFRFVGLPSRLGFPEHWQSPGVTAEVIGAPALVLGPEPLIGAQRVALRLADRRLTLASDGLGPFLPVEDDLRSTATPQVGARPGARP